MRSDMQVSKPRNQISTNISISVNPRKMTPTNENDKPVYRYIKYVLFLTTSVVYAYDECDRLECGRSWVRTLVGSNQRLKK